MTEPSDTPPRPSDTPPGPSESGEDLAARLATLDELIAGISDPTDRAQAQTLGFTLLNRTALLINADRTDEAVADATRLLELFTIQGEDQDLAGFGLMVCDAAGWVAGLGHPEPAVRMGEVVIDRLAAVDSDRARVTVARARFLTASGLTRLGRAEAAMEQARRLHTMGEAALEALAAAEAGQASTAIRLQIATHRASTLVALGRRDEARAQASALVDQLSASGAPHAEALIAEIRAEFGL